jgi:hypothetical protein
VEPRTDRLRSTRPIARGSAEAFAILGDPWTDELFVRCTYWRHPQPDKMTSVRTLGHRDGQHHVMSAVEAA